MGPLLLSRNESIKMNAILNACAGWSGMITGAAFSSVIYNLRLRHPTLDLPLIDYDLALLFQPMLVLGISIGVAFNVIFADWMITVLLIITFIGKSYLKRNLPCFSCFINWTTCLSCITMTCRHIN